MNTKKIVEMNGKTVTNLNKKIKNYTTTGDDTMKLDVTDVKLKLQKGYTEYLIGIKYVTYETANTILNSIAKDLRIYANVSDFIIRDNAILIRLEGNATLCAYYFIDKSILKEVIKELPKFDKGIIDLSKD